MNKRNPWHSPTVSWPFALLLLVASAAGVAMSSPQQPADAGAASPPPARPAPPSETTYQQPSKPLDARINQEKLTQYDPSPLPQQVVMPRPPVHRVASSADQVPMSAEAFAKAQASIARGLEFLRARQTPSGFWSPKAEAAPTNEPDKPSPVGIAITAFALKAFVQNGVDINKDEALAKALRVIVAGRQPDGSFSTTGQANYITSAVLSSLAAVGDQDNHDLMVDSIAWLKANQWDQEEGLSARQDWFGGAGYGNGKRPDMSNTQMMLDALYDAGLSPDEPVFQKALAFASRTQNLKETNKAPWVGNDGGFIYTPANGGESMASEAAGEGRYGEKIAAGQPRSLRSYGSMTYAGFKSMLYAGLSPSDVRVRAAFDWLRHNWTFEENPGLGQQGLYYYYHTLARALNAAQQDSITDIKGATHNWRDELVAAIVARQQDDGSWVNPTDRWMESDPALVTAYSVLALQEAIKPAHE
jgi:squalene-hopene/tetraprenyl-beta-curcumene cyclase